MNTIQTQHVGSRRDGRKRFLRGGAGPVLIALLCGCHDNRISYDELTRMESQEAAVEPAPIPREQLALTDVHPYHVGPGDVMKVTFTGLGEQFAQTTVNLRIADDGTVVLPMVGRLAVSGMDLKGVEKALYDAHVPRYVKDMGVFAELSSAETTTVMVVDADGAGQLVRLPQNERNVLYAVSRASAIGPGGTGQVTVQPIRSDKPALSFDLTNINDLRSALLAPPLDSGDMVVVAPTAMNAVFVIGLVNAPAPILIPKHGAISLVRAIAAAGGLRDLLDPEEATLWRRLPNGEQVRVKLALADVMDGTLPDVDLRPGDVLDIPHTAATRLREWAAMNIRIGPFGVTGMYDPVADYRARILRDDGNSNIIRQFFLPQIGSQIIGNVLTPAVTP